MKSVEMFFGMLPSDTKGGKLVKSRWRMTREQIDPAPGCVDGRPARCVPCRAGMRLPLPRRPVDRLACVDLARARGNFRRQQPPKPFLYWDWGRTW